MSQTMDRPAQADALYTPDQRARRDASPWTLVQGVLAPLQFVVFLVSLGLVLRYMATGAGYEVATLSIIIKTGVLYLIMITGAIWEKIVFGQWLFAPAFFWEDVFSFVVIALHTLYIVGLLGGFYGSETLMLNALAAYAAYIVNAGQFLWKLRVARLESEGEIRDSIMGRPGPLDVDRSTVYQSTYTGGFEVRHRNTFASAKEPSHRSIVI